MAHAGTVAQLEVTSSDMAVKTAGLQQITKDAFLQLKVGSEIHITYEDDGKFYKCKIDAVNCDELAVNVTYEGEEEEEDDVSIDRIYVAPATSSAKQDEAPPAVLEPSRPGEASEGGRPTAAEDEGEVEPGQKAAGENRPQEAEGAAQPGEDAGPLDGAAAGGAAAAAAAPEAAAALAAVDAGAQGDAAESKTAVDMVVEEPKDAKQDSEDAAGGAEQGSESVAEDAKPGPEGDVEMESCGAARQGSGNGAGAEKECGGAAPAEEAEATAAPVEAKEQEEAAAAPGGAEENGNKEEEKAAAPSGAAEENGSKAAAAGAVSEGEPRAAAAESDASNVLYLLGVDEDKSHGPQAFRMRGDQPLARLASCYAIFRGLTPEASMKLRMSTPRLGVLDPQSTAVLCGLSTGDQVTFSLPAEVGGSATAAAAAAPRAEKPAVATKQGRKAPKQPVARQKSAKDLACVPAGAAPKADGEAPQQGKRRRAACELRKKPLTPVFAFINERRAELQAREDCQGRHGVCRGGAEVYRSLPAEEQARYQKKYEEEKEAYDAWAASESGKEALLRAKEKRNLKSVGRKVLARTRAFAKPAANPLDLPAVPAAQMRTANVTTGPAKGWRVTVFVKGDTFWQVRWQIVSPGRARAFSNFRSLRRVAGDAIYAHIYTAVRPGLLKKMAKQRQTLAGIALKEAMRAGAPLGGVVVPFKRQQDSPTQAPVAKRRYTRAQAPPVVETHRPVAASKRSAGSAGLGDSSLVETPQKKAASPRQPVSTRKSCIMPDGTMQVVKVAAEGCAADWACECVGHLRRHPRCTPGQEKQPALIHLRDHMLVGRSDACDVVLDSTRTPAMISRTHAMLQCEGGAFSVTDHGSVNGVLVNGQGAHGRRPLAHGDVVTFGVPTQSPEFDYIFETRPAKRACP